MMNKLQENEILKKQKVIEELNKTQNELHSFKSDIFTERQKIDERVFTSQLGAKEVEITKLKLEIKSLNEKVNEQQVQITVIKNAKELLSSEMGTNKIKYKDKVSILNNQVTEQLRQI